MCVCVCEMESLYKIMNIKQDRLHQYRCMAHQGSQGLMQSGTFPPASNAPKSARKYETAKLEDLDQKTAKETESKV